MFSLSVLGKSEAVGRRPMAAMGTGMLTGQCHQTLQPNVFLERPR